MNPQPLENRVAIITGGGRGIGYGIALGNPVIAIPNSVAALVGALTMLVAWMLRHGTRSAD